MELKQHGDMFAVNSWLEDCCSRTISPNRKRLAALAVSTIDCTMWPAYLLIRDYHSIHEKCRNFFDAFVADVVSEIDPLTTSDLGWKTLIS
jgi:hypothetical protein